MMAKTEKKVAEKAPPPDSVFKAVITAPRGKGPSHSIYMTTYKVGKGEVKQNHTKLVVPTHMLGAGDRWGMFQGQKPHHRWIKLFPDAKGVKKQKSSTNFSITSLVDRKKVAQKGNVIVEFVRKGNAIYVELPEGLVLED
jgi:hypothetical protein